VALSAQSSETARKLRDAGRVLRSGPPPHPRLVVGGQAFNNDPGLREAVGGTYVGPNAAAASEMITSIAARTSGVEPGGERFFSSRRRRR
jgi:hypothetical protein